MLYTLENRNITELLANATANLPAAIETIDPSTYPEQLRDPHPKLTATSVILRATTQADMLCPMLYHYLTDHAPQYGFTVTGSYIGAVILEPIK